MRLVIDTQHQSLLLEDGSLREMHDLYSPQAFAIISRQWLRVGWSQKYSYGFAWLGRPVIQLPEDLLRIQEAIYQLRPDVLVHTGVAHGGLLIFCASLCHAMGRGRLIGIDVDIRPPNRSAIEAHPLSRYLTLVEGDSIDPRVVERVRASIRPDESVMVILDSAHSSQHVLGELRAYGDLVRPGGCILVQDGVMRDLADVPGGGAEWQTDNPVRAVQEFLAERTDFVLDPPAWTFNETSSSQVITYCPEGWLRRV